MIASNKVLKIIPYLILIIILLYTSKNSIIFNSNHKLRTFGLGYENGHRKTLYTMTNITIIISILLYIYI